MKHILEIGQSSFDSKSILSVDFYIVRESFDGKEDALLSGRVDWQDDLTIWQSECIEASDITEILEHLRDKVIPECIYLLGDNWKLGHGGQ